MRHLLTRLLFCLPGYWLACGANSEPLAPTGPDVADSYHLPSSSVLQTREPGGLRGIALGTDDPKLVDSRACQRCHQAEYQEWQQSRHSQAWTNAIFQNEFSANPKPWCVNCHAPTDAQLDAYATSSGENELVAQGVSCASCHVRNGTMVAAKKSPKSPHNTLISKDFSTSAFCADCHQFNFPRHQKDHVVGQTDLPMQPTVAQFASGPYGKTERQCLTCHDSPASHRFAGAHDRTMLARAVRVDSCLAGPNTLRVSVGNVGAGHNVPTGDVHRHILIRLWQSSSPEKLHDIFIGRRFAPAPDGGKRTAWDSTLSPGQTRQFLVPLGNFARPLAQEPLRLRSEYVYAPLGRKPHVLSYEQVHTTISETLITVAIATCTEPQKTK